MLALANKLTNSTQPIYRFVNKYSIDFDGVDDVIVTDGADTVAQNTTYAFWCKASTTTDNRGVFGHGNISEGAFHFNFGGSEPVLLLGAAQFIFWNNTPAQDDGKWHQWVVYADVTNITNSKLYVDGILQTSTSVSSSGTINAYTESLSIGGDRASGGSYFEGQIDEFAVFDRELKQDEITRMYNTYYTPNRVANGNFSQIGNEEVSNGDFSQEGSELVVNGDFATDSDWTKGTGWTISGGKANNDGSASGNSYLINSQQTVVVGNTYRVEFTISNYTQGIVRVRAGTSLTPSFISANGTYIVYMVAASTETCRVQGQNNFIGSIDNVSIKEVGQDWTFSGWGMGDNNQAVLTGTGQGNNLFQQALTQNDSYEAIIDVVVTQGSVRVLIGGGTGGYNQIGEATSTGTFTYYGKSSGSSNNVLLQSGNNSIPNSVKINSIKIKEVGQNWTLGAGTTIENGVANITAASSGGSSLSQAGGVFVSGKSFKVSFTISNYSSGSIAVSNLSPTTFRNANGTYTLDAVGAGGDFLFFSSGFVGSVDNIVVQELKSDATNLMLNAGAYQSANPLITSTNSMEFDGVDNYLSSTGRAFGTDNVSVACWINLDAWDNYDGVWSNRNNTGTNIGFQCRTTGTVGNIELFADFGSSTITSTATGLSTSKWHYIVCTMDRSGNQVIYLDGFAKDTDDISTHSAISMSNVDVPFFIGKDQGNAEADGNITEFGIWDRVLTDLEVASLYNQGMPTNLLVNRNDYQSGNPTVFNTKQVDFDGVDDFLKVTNDYGTQFTGSFSVWLKRNSSGSSMYLIDARGEAASGVGYILVLATSIFISSGTIYVDGVASTTIPADTNWHHIVITGMTIKINYDLTIGARYNYQEELDGEMSQVGMWNSTLTADEVSSLYNHGLPVDLKTDQAAYTSSSNLVGYWRMGSGTLDSYPLIADQTNATLSAEYVKNGDFSQEGSELVTNGGFETDSNWALNTGWSIHEGSGIYGYAESDGTNSPMDQAGILTVGKQYKVEITVTNMTASPLSVRLGSSSSTQILAITSDGTYTAYGTAGADRLRLRSQGFNGRITNVSVKEVLQNWTSATQDGAYQELTANGLKMYSGSVAGASNAMSATSALNLTGTLGKTYKLEVTASDFVSMNSCTIRLNNQYDSNNVISFVDGTQTVYFVAYVDFTFIRFYGGSTEDGVTIKSISIKEVGGNPAIMTNMTASDIENGSPYAQLVQNGTFATDTDWDKKNGSTISGGVGNVIANGDLGNTGGNWSLNQDVGMIVDKSYKISFKARQTGGTGNFQVGQAYKIGFSQSITSSFENYTFIITPNDFSGNTGKITIGGATVGNTFEVDSVTVTEVNTGLQGYWKMGDGINDEFPVIYDQTNPTLGAEEVTNGDFSNDSDWNKGTGWTIANGKASSNGSGGSFIYQSLSSLTTGDTLKVVYEIVDYTSGQIRIGFGSGFSNFGTYRSALGTYTEYIKKTSSNTTFGLVNNSSNSFIGSIDNVSVKEVQGNSAYMTNMVEGNITNQYPLTKIRNYYRMGDGILDGFPIIQDQTSPNLAHIPTTNLATYSENFTTLGWGHSQVNVVSNSVISPDGTQNASTITPTTVSAVHLIATTGTNTVAMSVYAKQNGYTRFRFNTGSSSNGFASYNLSTGVIIASSGTYYFDSGIEDVGNGWFRCFLVIKGGSATNTTIAIENNSGQVAFAGDGTSGLHFWGGQTEEQTQPTAYLKSDGIAAVRKATTTNLLPYSEDFENAAWTKYKDGTGSIPVLTANNILSPDGLQNGTKIVYNAGSGTSGSDQSLITDSVSVPNNSIATVSIYLKGQNGGEQILLRGVAVSSYKLLTLTTEWQRFSTTENSGTTNDAIEFGIRQSVSGHGVINSSATIYAWGAQTEEQTQAETYAKTTGLPVTIDLFTENNYGTMTNMVAGDIVLDTPNNPA